MKAMNPHAFSAPCRLAATVALAAFLLPDPATAPTPPAVTPSGHPVAATGARMLVTLVHELRRRGGGIGVAAMCAGGGMGSATVIEVPAP